MNITNYHFVFVRHIHRPLGWEWLATYSGDTYGLALQRAQAWIDELLWARTTDDVYISKYNPFLSDDVEYQRLHVLLNLNLGCAAREDFPHLVENVQHDTHGPSYLRTLLPKVPFRTHCTPSTDFTVPSRRRL